MYRLLVGLARKSAFARLSRTLLVILMIAVSMSLMLALQGIYDGMTMNMIEKTKRSDCGEVSLYAKGYRLNPVLQNSIKDADQIKASIAKRPEVKAVVARFRVEGLSATARKSAFANIIGIDLEEEVAFGDFEKFLIAGEMVLEGRGAVIGSALAKRLKVGVGAKVIFSTQESSGEINAMAVKIRGIVRTSNITLDRTALYVSSARLHTFLDVAPGEATQIAVRTASEQLHDELQHCYPQLEVKTLLELYPMLKQMQEIMVIFNSITFSIVMLVVFIGIFGVMYVSVLERVREFGIMRAVGMPYCHIRTQVIFEALFVGMTGYLSGASAGLLGLLYLHYVGLDLSTWAEGLESFGYDAVIYAQIKPVYFVSTFLAIITASLMSVVLPLRKIKSVNPIDVIKAET